VKQDGYRLIVQREGKRVRLFIRNGHVVAEVHDVLNEALYFARGIGLADRGPRQL
jgi:ATP-dependent DNA ligase